MCILKKSPFVPEWRLEIKLHFWQNHDDSILSIILISLYLSSLILLLMK
jgi:hypothetical protein